MTSTAVAPAKAGTGGPKVVTIQGRLSFPVWTAQAAYDRSQSGKYPAKDVASAAPEFNLLIEEHMLDRLRGHIVNEFLPYCVEQEKAGEKRDVLSAQEVADLTAQLEKPDFAGVYNLPLKALSDKSAALAPECVATVKVIGNKGVDMEQKAVVNDAGELLIPDADILSYPVLRPIGATVHSMYAGAYVAVTLNLYAYHNGKLPGFSAGGGVAVFKADAERFGGGVSIDEDAIFMD